MGATMGAALQGEAVLVAKSAEIRVAQAAASLETQQAEERVTEQYQGLPRQVQ